VLHLRRLISFPHLTLLHLCICNLGNIDGIAIEEFGDFFQGRVPCLDNEEIDDHDFEDEEYTVEQVIFPCECLEGNGVDILIEEERGSYTEV
jgi:hypothetical protein